MNKIALSFSFAAASALLFATGCSNSASMENQSTNAAAGQPPSVMKANPPAGAEMTNAVPSAGLNASSAGMDMNSQAKTNTMNTNTNMAPP